MSRTDKDVPWWVTAKLWEPRHSYCQFDWSRWRTFTFTRECDLAPEPMLHMWRDRYRRLHCHWRPVWVEYKGARHRSQWMGFVDVIDKSPSKAKVRDSCIAAKKEYNSTRWVDTEPPACTTRHLGRLLS